MKKIIRSLGLVVLAGLLISCGGGSSVSGGCVTGSSGCVTPVAASSSTATSTASSATATNTVTSTLAGKPASMSYVGTIPTSNTIVIKGAGGSGRTESAILTFKIIDVFGNAAIGVPVTFSVNDSTVTLAQTTATSDGSGLVTAAVSAGSVPTSFRVTASMTSAITSTSVSSLSDNVGVSTGQPSQYAFSFLSDNYAPDCNIYGTTTNVTARIADLSGNPISQNTFVTMTTVGGAVGTSSAGGCYTDNTGACTTKFTCNDPIPTNGTATLADGTTTQTAKGIAQLTASIRDSSNTIIYPTIKPLAIVMSMGNNTFVSAAYVNSTDSGITLAKKTKNPSLTGLVCGDNVIGLTFTETNDNPIPANTTFTIGTTSKTLTASLIAPSKQPQPTNLTTLTAGSSPINFLVSAVTTIDPLTGNTVCPVGGNIPLTLTTPAGNTTYIGINVAFQQMRLITNLALVGLMGAGKTTVGKALAKRLSRQFYDTDHVIEARCGVKVPTIFEMEGEEGFRDRESLAIAELCQQSNIILATGGGAVLRPQNRQILRDHCTVIYLRATPHDLWVRTRHDKNRPLLQTDDPKAKLEQLFQLRDPMYRETAHFVIDTGKPSVSQLVNTVLMQLELAGIPLHPPVINHPAY